MRFNEESRDTLHRNIVGERAKRVPFGVIYLVVLVISASSGCEAADTTSPVESKSPISPTYVPDASGSITLPEIASYVGAYDWVEVAGPGTLATTCNELLAELRAPKLIHALHPRIEAASATDPGLGELARCANYHSEERANVPLPNSYIEGVGDFGDQFFRLYRVTLGSRESKTWDIVYGEFREDKVKTNAYMDGFTVVDLSTCIKLSGVSTQRPLKGDLDVSAPRQVAKGLFAYKGQVVLITRTEQIGHLQDPTSFRAINVWSLADNGVFSQSCAWNPKGLVGQVNSGKAK